MKQKHWQVSVFDKTSEIIKDDTFYTTDTEAYLVFELIDEDFKPDSAMVTVYNIYGTAIINVSVEVADGIVRYEMPNKAIRHRGGWRTQAIFTKDGEDYTTAIIEFDVGGHLLDNKKPAIVDIENWNSFIKHAGELVDDWEQLEEIRQTNEEQRELAESARQTTFETNESERQSEFETNETSRQTNELVREEAEGNRQSTFEENELARETAESVRVANEEERISKDIERDSKIEAVEGLQADLISGAVDSAAVQQHVEERYGQLEEEYAPKLTEVTAQLAEKATKQEINLKADKTYVNSLTQSIATGSPKGVYATLSALQTAFPTGTTGTYVVSADGKWYYWDGTAWTSGGMYQSTLSADFPATNLVTNGNFVNTTGWVGNASTLSATNNECTVMLTSVATSVGAYKATSMPTGNKFYIAAEVMPKYAGNISIGFTDKLTVFSAAIPNQYNKLSAIGIKSTSNNVAIYHNTTTGGYIVGDTFKIKNVIVIDLTATFGLGKEPTVKEMDTILSKFPNSWFDGTVSPLFGGKELFNDYRATKLADFPATNLVINSDFSNGVNGWLGNESTISAIGNECTVTITTIGPGVGIMRDNVVMPTGNKFYIAFWVKPKYVGNITFGYGDVRITKSGAIANQYNKFSAIGTKSTSNIIILFHNTTANYVVGDTFKIKNVIVIDLTATFGVGNEPTVEEMDIILNEYPNSWFDGTVSPLFGTKELFNYYKSNSSVIGKMPSPLRPDYTLTVAGGVPSDVSASGVVYGSNGNTIYKSSDYGVTTIPLVTLPGTITPTVAWVQKMDDGSVVSAIVNRDLDIGEIWRSDTNEENFEKVFTFITPKSKPSPTFGYSKFKNILLVNEYGADKSYPNNPRRGYMSLDYGATWTQIFEAWNIEGVHPHDIQYDPYEDIIWVVSGDGTENRLVWYSVDRGHTWKTIIPPVQFTNISVLPNCILFGTDTVDIVGFYRLDRPESGLRTATNLQIVEAYIQTRNHPQMPIACKSYSDFTNGVVYSAFYETAPWITIPATIYATKDGYNFYIVWQSDTLPTATANGVGVLAIAGASSDGNLVAYVRLLTNSTLRLTMPDWE